MTVKLNRSDIDNIVGLYNSGVSPKEIMCMFPIGNTHFFRILKQHGVEPRIKTLVDNRGKDLATAYSSGMSIDDVAREYGVSRNTVARSVRLHGLEMRGPQKWSRFTEHDRAEISKNVSEGIPITQISKKFGVCKSVIYRIMESSGIPKTMGRSRTNTIWDGNKFVAAQKTVDEMVKHANTIQNSGNPRNATEAELGRLLSARGLNPVHELAIGYYNVDIGLCESRVSVEVFVGGWHLTDKHVASYKKRIPYILDRGWSVIILWLRSGQQIGSGAIDYLVAATQQIGRDKPVRGKYGVITGNGKLISRTSYKYKRLSPPLDASECLGVINMDNIPRQ